MTIACSNELTLRPVRPNGAALLGELIDGGLSWAARYYRVHGAKGRLSGCGILLDSSCHGGGKRVPENPVLWVEPTPLHTGNAAVVSPTACPQRGLTANWPSKAPHMHHRLRQRLAALAIATLAGPALAGVVTLSGNLGDPTNTALVASDMGPALFLGDLDTSNNVALHTLHVALAGTVSFKSNGYASGGIDPYFTLFSGTDQASATVRDSNYLNAFGSGGDFTQDIMLTAGDYTVAIGVFANLSFAENLGTGFLANGFTALGGPGFLGNGSYSFTVTLPDATTVPEPGGVTLVLIAAFAASLAGGLRRSRFNQI